jgi:hypothetical protein
MPARAFRYDAWASGVGHGFAVVSVVVGAAHAALSEHSFGQQPARKPAAETATAHAKAAHRYTLTTDYLHGAGRSEW